MCTPLLGCGPLVLEKCFVLGCPNGKPILVITDSIGKALPPQRSWEHVLLSGKSFPDATARVYDRSMAVGGRRVIAIHLGTNGVCHRTWARTTSLENRLNELMIQVKQLYTAIRTFNGTCFIIFSAVLPRKVDWSDTKSLCLKFNNSLKKFCTQKHCGYMPTYTSFAIKKGDGKGDPIPGLWAVKDGGLHLNLQGRFLFSQRFKHALHPKQLRVMARGVGF